MKHHPFFLNLMMIGVFSLSFLTMPGRTPKAIPTPGTPLLDNIIAIAAGGYHTCALTAGGGVKCWGDNFYGQLGDGTTTHRHTPVWVSGLANVTAIAAGWFYTCALTSGGGVKCWGYNGYGQLGNGSTTDRHAPVNVSGLTNGVDAITAGGDHTCALMSSGGIKCWGYNGYGQMGDGTTTDHHTPANVFWLGSLPASVSAGWMHTCAVSVYGTAKCWGNNGFGRLGDGTTTDRHAPVTVSGLVDGVSAIYAGGYHTCATTDSEFKCWGWNGNGNLGDGTTTNRHTPVDVFWVIGPPDTVSAGTYHTCALAGDGAKCWGDNDSGQVGDGTTTNRLIPTWVSGLDDGVGAISAGGYHTCALMSGGGVKCWGANGYGQLGDGTTTDRHTPVDVLAPQLTFRSAAAQDGWVLESGENTNTGGSLNATANLAVGDNILDRQYRSLLYFDTATLPDNATIIKVTLRIKYLNVSGTDPFTTHGQLWTDIRTGVFGNAALENGDFEAVASKGHVGHFTAVGGGWYRLNLTAADFVYINLTGVTQFRLRFATDDNDDNGADFLTFSSGNAAEANRPQLIIEYVVP